VGIYGTKLAYIHYINPCRQSMIKVTADFSQATKHMDNISKRQIPFAASQALNDMAWLSTLKLQSAAQAQLDKPTPFTLRGFKYQRSTKKRLESIVYVAPIQEKYLKYQIEGGVRKDKGDAGRVIIPVSIKKNAYGNIPGKKSGLSKQKKRVTAVINGTKGVWVVSGGKNNKRLRLGAYYAKEAKYDKKFKFHKTIADVVGTKLDSFFHKRLRLALRTAR